MKDFCVAKGEFYTQRFSHLSQLPTFFMLLDLSNPPAELLNTEFTLGFMQFRYCNHLLCLLKKNFTVSHENASNSVAAVTCCSQKYSL